jgi:GxxExxY protein
MLETPERRMYHPIPPETEHIGKIVIDSAYKVHTTLGPGLLESVYEACLALEVRKSGVSVETQVAIPVTYEDKRIESGLRLDMLVDRCVIVEIKAVEKMTPLYDAQLLTYLKISGLRLGFLINFNVPHLKTV